MNIRQIKQSDRDEYISMCRAFYASDAVLHNIPDKNIFATFDELMTSDVYTVCYIFEKDGCTVGYSLLARSFSQEAGGKVLWIEELYIKPEFRNMGIAGVFFEYIKRKYPDVKRIRLETEKDNIGARRLYTREGFEELPYLQMVLDK